MQPSITVFGIDCISDRKYAHKVKILGFISISMLFCQCIGASICLAILVHVAQAQHSNQVTYNLVYFGVGCVVPIVGYLGARNKDEAYLKFVSVHPVVFLVPL